MMGQELRCPKCNQYTPDRCVCRRQRRYGYADKGGLIVPPAGWRLLAEGETVPQVHREWIDPYWGNGWCAPRRCHSTMTPITACVWGAVRAIAVPE